MDAALDLLKQYPNYCFPSWQLRDFCLNDVETVCSWVNSKKVLRLVSSDDGDGLSSEILYSWTCRAAGAYVLLDDRAGIPVGFCTLSASEITHHPHGFIELCHLIVNPLYKYLHIGSTLCSKVKRLVKALSYNKVYGRVVPGNLYGVALARRQHFEEILSVPSFLPSGFRWFCCKL